MHYRNKNIKRKCKSYFEIKERQRRKRLNNILIRGPEMCVFSLNGTQMKSYFDKINILLLIKFLLIITNYSFKFFGSAGLGHRDNFFVSTAWLTVIIQVINNSKI